MLPPGESTHPAYEEIRREVEAEMKYHEYLAFIEETHLKATRNEFHLDSPKTLWLAITENCNLRCVGCYTEGLFKKVYIDIADVRSVLSAAGNTFEYISLTEGEALLHPEFCDVVEICKELQPQAKIWVISNGTIPIKGRFRKAIGMIDRLGLSIDGATKETYEGIRRGANFERFLENVKDIVEVRQATGFPRDLAFSFTATRTNLSELAGVVRIAHELGVPEVWAQPMEAGTMEEIVARIGAIEVKTMPRNEVQRHLENARTEAMRLDVKFSFAAGLIPGSERKADQTKTADPDRERVRQSIIDELAVRMCQYTWREDFRYLKTGGKFQILPCCYIHGSIAGDVAKRFGLEFAEPPSSDAVFNSDQYWQFRKDLAAGKLAEVCGQCSAAKLYPWQPKKTAS